MSKRKKFGGWLSFINHQWNRLILLLLYKWPRTTYLRWTDVRAKCVDVNFRRAQQWVTCVMRSPLSSCYAEQSHFFFILFYTHIYACVVNKNENRHDGRPLIRLLLLPFPQYEVAALATGKNVLFLCTSYETLSYERNYGWIHLRRWFNAAGLLSTVVRWGCLLVKIRNKESSFSDTFNFSRIDNKFS